MMDNRINIDKAAHRVMDFHLTSMLLCGLNGTFIDGDFVASYHEERLYSVKNMKTGVVFLVYAGSYQDAIKRVKKTRRRSVRKTNKEDVIHKIKAVPISTFECDNREPFPEELSVDCNKYFNNYSISTQHTVSTLAVDLVQQTDEMIFAQIEEIIKQSGLQTLYVLNRQQIIEALQQYTKNNT